MQGPMLKTWRQPPPRRPSSCISHGALFHEVRLHGGRGKRFSLPTPLRVCTNLKEMTYKYFPHTPADIEQMLRATGVGTLDELYADVPSELRVKGEVNLPSALSESELRRVVNDLQDETEPAALCLAGAGSYQHYRPAAVDYLAQRSEFSTSYTPYQAEISQGTLSYIFEYQTMMARLTGMDVSNASMYDGSTATAEAMMMCVAASKRRSTVVISGTFLPAVLRVVRTYAHYHGVNLVEIAPCSDGLSDLEAIGRRVAQGDVAGVIVPQPNRYGLIEDFTGLSDTCHTNGALLCINTMAFALGVLKSPGDWGADIACGDAQSLGLPLSLGGPYIGYLCVKRALVRKMPGRLVGATTDAQGRRCFVLTLQAREQHIRREKATSNICTAQGYMCLFVAGYLSLMGQKGLRQAAAQSYAAAHYLQEKLLETGLFEEAFPQGAFLHEFTLRYVGEGTAQQWREQVMADMSVLPGVLCDGEGELITFCATEETPLDGIDAFIDYLKTPLP